MWKKKLSSDILYFPRPRVIYIAFISNALQALGGDATLLFYGTEEGNEGKTAYVDHRPPDFSKFPRRP